MSEVWSYFTKSGSTVTCNGCDFKAATNRDCPVKASAMWYHLQKVHPDVYKRTQYYSERSTAESGSNGRLTKETKPTASVSSEKPLKSEVWNYFAKNASGDIHCGTCDRKVAQCVDGQKQSTSPMWEHLKSFHRDIYSATAFSKSRESAIEPAASTKHPTDQDPDPDSDMKPASSRSIYDRTNIPTKAPCKKVVQQIIRRSLSLGRPAPVTLRAQSLPRRVLRRPPSPSPLAASGSGTRLSRRSSPRSLSKKFKARRSTDSSSESLWRARTIFTVEQTLTLEEAFKRSQFATGNERAELAKSLGVPDDSVRIWFQNRRAKGKKAESSQKNSSRGAEPMTSKQHVNAIKLVKQEQRNDSLPQPRKLRAEALQSASSTDSDDNISATLPVTPDKSTDSSKPTPYRVPFTAEQLQILEERFERSSFVTNEERAQLAQVVGVTEKQIKNWFQNRRMKAKKQASDVCGPPSMGQSKSTHPRHNSESVVFKAAKQENDDSQILKSPEKPANKSESADSSKADDLFDDRLITEVKRRPVLYDPSHPNHHQVTTKIVKHWQEVADALDAPVGRVRTRWRTLRDGAVKEQKRIRDGEEPRWRHYERMAFYVPFIQSKMKCDDDEEDVAGFFNMVKQKYKRLDLEEREKAKTIILEAVKAT